MHLLTPEQANVVQTATTGIPLKAIAFAGAGKTSTLTAVARALRSDCLYMAFNKSIAEDAARKFSRNVTCKTAHAVAFKVVAGMGYPTEGKMTGKVQSRQFLSHIGEMAHDKAQHGLAAHNFCSAVYTTLRNYCMSWDDEIRQNHVPDVPGLTEAEQTALDASALRASVIIWEKMADPSDPLPLGHDGYVKVWALGRPVLRYDTIFVDEAQDLNSVLIGALRTQSVQLISVGDSHQQIYGWRGARDALKILPGTECRLTQSFRFGPHIAHAANKVLMAMGEEHPLRGFDQVQDNVSHDVVGAPELVDAILCRSNAGVIENAMEMQDAGRKVYVPGGTNDMAAMVRDAGHLQNGQSAHTLDLMAFTDWNEVSEFADTPEGAGLRVFVNLVDRYGVGPLLRCLDAIQTYEAPGSVTISTAHKSKGLEWNRVLLHTDFLASDNIALEEQRLFYVAMTRAKRQLYVSAKALEAYSR